MKHRSGDGRDPASAEGAADGPESGAEDTAEHVESASEGGGDRVGSKAEGAARPAGWYGTLLFCPVRHAGGQFAIELCGDAGYDTGHIFAYCREPGIAPLIRIRNNSTSKALGVDRMRSLAAQDQLYGNNPCPKNLALMDKSERARTRRSGKSASATAGSGWSR